MPFKDKQKRKEYNQKYGINHSEQISIHKKQYILSYNKRHRELGFVPLNQYFNGSNAHHLDIDNVIYIPTELHQAYPHQQNNNEQMKEINIKAWNYLEASVL